MSPDSRHVVSVAVWNITSGTLVSDVRTEHGDVRDCMFTPDGSGVVSVHADGRVAVWRVNSLRELLAVDTTVPSDGSHRWRRVAGSPDSARLAISGWNGAVDIWDLDRVHYCSSL